ncbi:MAG: glutamate-1-semialdehyde 2,1-aminomutase [Chloroflexi bacterium GWC2_73_18]|nr:MAG: glutamate-1-semialdehyde 2,1-aminomutase [Chloroflexi bacterium GWC2_73_18]
MRRLASRPAYRTDRSAAAYAAAQRVVAGGINSGARGPRAGWVPGPPVVHHGRGPRIWDVDGNEYVDYLLALGPLIHGHAHPALIGAVEAAMSEIGTMFALPYELEAAAAERIVAAVPSAELVRFGNSGTEVVLHAVRLARAVTGRPRILRFEGHYHGWADQVEWSHPPPLEAAGPRSEPRPVPGSPGIPAALAETLFVLPWNDPEAVDRLFARRGGEIAAVLTEPVMGNTGVIPPQPGYLEALRDITRRHDALLIFDEVITGFRVAYGGAQTLYGVTPDLTTLAKALGGGYPVAALAGRRDLMEPIAEGEVLHAGTYNANTIAVAAAKASTELLARPGTYEALFALAERLTSGIGGIFERAGIPVQVQGVGPMFQFWFAEQPIVDYRGAAAHLNSPRFAALARALHARGVLVHPSNIELWFVSTAHTAADIDETLAAFDDAVAASRAELGGRG